MGKDLKMVLFVIIWFTLNLGVYSKIFYLSLGCFDLKTKMSILIKDIILKF